MPTDQIDYLTIVGWASIRRWLVLGLFLVISIRGRAQQWEIGAGLGAMVYKGDMAPNFAFHNCRPAGNLLVRYNASQSFTLRLNLGLGQLAAQDSKVNDPFLQARGLSFSTWLQEANLLTEYNFLNYSSRRNVKDWTPYVFGGLGLFMFQPNPQSPGYPTKMLMSFPLGVGIKYEFNRPWSIGLEFGTRFTWTDYLDNFGEVTFDGTEKLRQGNPDSKDMYTYMGVTLTYTFYKITCPE